MAITLVNPAGLPEVGIYRQVSVATGSRLVHVAGQVAVDADGTRVGDGDLTAQVEQCYLNVATALAAAGDRAVAVLGVQRRCHAVEHDSAGTD